MNGYTIRVKRLRKNVEILSCIGSNKNPDSMTNRGTDDRHNVVMIPIQKVLLPVTTVPPSPI